ncbi:MAG: S8 family serine peptidase [Chitinophagaceae bacterium]
MKHRIILLLLISFAQYVYSQYPKYIIQFTDKNNDPYSISNSSQFLSAKAIERRTKFNILIDSSDLPVNPFYVDSVLSKGNVQLLSKSKWLNQILIYTTDANAIQQIQLLPFVKFAQAIGFRAFPKDSLYPKFKEKVSPLIPIANKIEGPNSLYNYGNSYNQIHIHLGEFLHDKGFNGQGITIAMLDAGFNNYDKISVFDSARLNNQILGVRDFVAFDNSVTEDDVHGMYCLSIIVANLPGQMIGSAPKANFWLIRTENAASEYPVEEHNWVVGAEFADSAGADMISSSLGYNQFDDSNFNHTYANFYNNSTIISQGAAIACNKGMIVTNSAGNEGQSAWKYILFPADADSVCSVGAIDTLGNIAPFSSYGYPGRVKPNIVSVGWNTVIASASGPVTGSGTSFSNPNIAGLIACLWQAFPLYNNITILNAVYQSADRYTSPNNRYGFGIPNMQKAYLILKHKQNVELYGNDWLFATPDTFINEINVKLVGRIYGNAALKLIDANGAQIATHSLITEQEEIYNYSFTGLDNVPPGNYFIKYIDSLQTRNIAVVKLGNVTLKDWLQASPVPFDNKLSVYLKAPETGKIFLRLLNADGKIMETISLDAVQSNLYTLQFSTINKLAKAVYFVQYIGLKQKKTIKIVKQ